MACVIGTQSQLEIFTVIMICSIKNFIMAENKKKQEEKRQDRLLPHNGNQGGNRFSQKENQGHEDTSNGDQDGSENKRSGSHKADMRERENDTDQAEGEGRAGSNSNAG